MTGGRRDAGDAGEPPRADPRGASRDEESPRREGDAEAELPSDEEAGPPRARIRETAWKGWVWSVPIAAFLLVGYLVVRTWFVGGTSITVHFPSAHGITGKAETPVRYRGLPVGKVTDVELDHDHGGVVFHVSMDGSVSDALRSGTRFWIESPSPLSGNLSGILSGPHLAMEPGSGEPIHDFQGLLEAPPVAPPGPGVTVVAHASDAGGVQRGAPVRFRGMTVGRVLGTELAPSGEEVLVHLFVRAPYDRRVRRDARFWSCGGVKLTAGSGGPGIQVSSLPALVEGCVAFDDFRTGDTTRLPKDAAVPLYSGADAARHAFVGSPVAVEIRVPGSVGGLERGSPVELEGIQVGRVRSVELRTDSEGVSTPVTLELDPGRFGLGKLPAGADSARALYRALDGLVRKGLRAQAGPASLLLGGAQVSLVMVGSKGSATLDTASAPPVLPAIGGGSLQSVVARVGRVADQLGSIPIRSIGRNVSQAAESVNRTASSPDLQASIRHLNQALASLDSLTATARTRLGPALSELQSAASAVDRITGGSLRNQEGLGDLVDELTRAARSLRELGDYLSRHPEALIKGRSSRP